MKLVSYISINFSQFKLSLDVMILNEWIFKLVLNYKTAQYSTHFSEAFIRFIILIMSANNTPILCYWDIRGLAAPSRFVNMIAIQQFAK